MTARLFLVLLACPLLLAAAPELALQPEGRDAVNPPRTVDIQHLGLDLAVDVMQRRVDGSAAFTATPIRAGVREIVLDQVALDIGAVTVDGSDVRWRQTSEKLHVTLEEPPAMGAPFELVVEYSASPTNGLHFRLPGPQSPDTYAEAWSQGEDTDHRHWFPLWMDPSDRFTYEGAFTVEDRFTAVSGGELVGKEPTPGRAGWTTWQYRLEQDIVGYLVALAVAEYERYDDSWDGIPLETYAPPGTGEEVARRATSGTADMMAFFAEVTGVRYPYPVYRQIFVQRFMYGGMENTTATIMSDRILTPAHLMEEAADTHGTVAHELAHQWYGDLLTFASWREMWLNEGFATFFGNLWSSHRLGPEYHAGSVWGWYRGVRNADEHRARPLVTTFYNLAAGDGRANPYGKGASVLQMLRVMLGDDVFFDGIALYTRRHQHGLVQTEHLRHAMEEVSGTNLDWFFDQWVYLVGHPQLEVRHRVDTESGRLSVTMTQTQEVGGAVPLFVLPIDVEIATTEGTRVERVWMDGEEVTASWPLRGELRYVGIDPKGGLVAAIDHDRSADELVAQLGSEHPYSVVSAFEALKLKPGKVTDAERAAVRGFLADPEAPLSHRKRAAATLGDWRDDVSVTALLEELAAEQARDGGGSMAVRAMIAGALGRGVARPEVVAALEGLLARDPSEQIRASALRSLAVLLEEGVRPAALTTLQGRPGHRLVLHQAAIDLLGHHGRVSDLRALSRHRKPSTDRGVLHAAIWASARIAAREDPGLDRDAAREPIARDAERLLHSLDLRTRQQAISVLKMVGDGQSVAALGALRRRENEEALIPRIDRTIDAIRSRDDSAPDETEGELEARLKRIEERIDEAEAELKKLEERP